jgi:hypothetical protein
MSFGASRAKGLNRITITKSFGASRAEGLNRITEIKSFGAYFSYPV